MLQITETARSLLDQLRFSQGLPDHYGVRLFAAARLNGRTPIQISFRDMPDTGDQVDETAGGRIFVSPEISAADLVLDVDQDENGAQLILREPDETG